MTRYTRANRPPIRVRTLNPTEITVISRLEKEGWLCVKRGWADLIAAKDGHLRLIVIRRPRMDGLPLTLKARQRMVATMLNNRFGITVEILCR